MELERAIMKLKIKNKKITKTLLIIIALLIINLLTTMGIVAFLCYQYQPDTVRVPIEVIEDLDPVPTEELKF